MRENIKNVQIYYLSENQLLIAKPRSLSGILFNMYTAEDRAQSYDASAGAFSNIRCKSFPIGVAMASKRTLWTNGRMKESVSAVERYRISVMNEKNAVKFLIYLYKIHKWNV